MKKVWGFCHQPAGDLSDPAGYILNNSEMDPNSGCWLWTLAHRKNGYGATNPKLGDRMAHRVSYMAFKGEIPKGHHVMHKCDTPCCVNPEHLSVGTPSENMKDMVSKGRHGFQKDSSKSAWSGNKFPRARGEKASNSKLNDEIVREIRASSERNVFWARRLSVNADTIYRIRAKLTWAHVE